MVRQLPLLAAKEFAIRGIVMSDSKVALYESLVRLSLLLVFMFALVVGTVGVFSICQMLMQSEMPKPEFVSRDLS